MPAAKSVKATPESKRPGLALRYLERAVPALNKQFEYENPMQVPQIKKVIVNIGIGEGATDSRALESAVNDVREMTGQQPIVVRSRKAVAAFKLRVGMPVGIKCTLRGRRMWYFLEKLIGVALPRIRDFRGISPRAFDGKGNYSVGLREQIIFPEIDYDKIDKLRGLEVAIVTTARTDEEGRSLLAELGMPFRQL
ncbi:MAG: 50S ribosomal protein L5 [Candidatus Dormibacteraceae bacterium]